MKSTYLFVESKSRSDDTLLTAGFNLRIKRTDSPL